MMMNVATRGNPWVTDLCDFLMHVNTGGTDQELHKR